MVEAICEVQDAGIEVDVWKVEGLENRADCLRVVGAAQRNTRHDVSCIVLGRAAAERKIVDWLTVAASVPGYIGFAVGRTTFWDAISDLNKSIINRRTAAAQIAQRYHTWIDIFERTRYGTSNQQPGKALA
jgi:myo-inositol catabolism protein IolC